jgi:hypothetical protein
VVGQSRNPVNKKSLWSNKKHSGRPLQQASTSVRHNLCLKIKWILKKKQKNSYSNNSKTVKGICKNSVAPSKRPDLRIMSIKEEVQAKGICNISIK